MRPATAKRRARDHAVREHLQDRAADAERVRRREPEQDESHVADARIADDEFEVALPQRDGRGIDDPDDAEDRDPFAPQLEAEREEIHRDAQGAISAKFHDDAGEQHRTGGRRGDVAGGRPGVQRPDAGEHGEPEKQNGKGPGLELRRELKLRELLQIECAGLAGRDVNGDDADEDQRAAEEGIERQLHRAVFLVRGTPDRDEEIFRHDDQLVEDEEQKEIGAEKDAVGSAHDEEEPEEELVRPLLDVPGEKDRADRGQSGDQTIVRLMPSAAR